MGFWGALSADQCYDTSWRKLMEVKLSLTFFLSYHRQKLQLFNQCDKRESPTTHTHTAAVWAERFLDPAQSTGGQTNNRAVKTADAESWQVALSGWCEKCQMWEREINFMKMFWRTFTDVRLELFLKCTGSLILVCRAADCVQFSARFYTWQQAPPTGKQRKSCCISTTAANQSYSLSFSSNSCCYLFACFWGFN